MLCVLFYCLYSLRTNVFIFSIINKRSACFNPNKKITPITNNTDIMSASIVCRILKPSKYLQHTHGINRTKVGKNTGSIAFFIY